MVPFPMILSDPDLEFKVTIFLTLSVHDIAIVTMADYRMASSSVTLDDP